MKTLAALGIAFTAIGLSPIVAAETNATAHAETASALRCLLDHGPDGCRTLFVGSASRAAQPWLWHDSNRDFELGALLSSRYARTETGEGVVTLGAVLLDRVQDRRPVLIHSVPDTRPLSC